MPVFTIKVIGVNGEVEMFTDEMSSLENAVNCAVVGLATATNMIFEADRIEIYEQGSVEPDATVYAVKRDQAQTTIH